MTGKIETPFFQKIYYANCQVEGSINKSIPYTVTLDPGYYKIELWGASGGGYGGKGGYTSAKIRIETSTTYYLYIGGQGGVSTNSNATGGCNGGGHGYHGNDEIYNRENAGGGGATDIRTIQNDLNSRILIAAGGGGSGIAFAGGDAGGEIGYNGIGWINNNIWTNGTGATQTEGGIGGYYFTEEVGAENGSLGFGGQGIGIDFSGGGGGAGLYGGGGAYESGGGGGSSYINPDKFIDGILKSGRDRFPSPLTRSYETGHIGDGYARIFFLTLYKTVDHLCCHHSNYLPSMTFFAIFLGTIK